MPGTQEETPEQISHNSKMHVLSRSSQFTFFCERYSTMSNESKIDDEVTRKWQALTQEVFEGFEPLFEATFVNGTANNRPHHEMRYKTTGFIEEIKDGV